MPRTFFVRFQKAHQTSYMKAFWCDFWKCTKTAKHNRSLRQNAVNLRENRRYIPLRLHCRRSAMDRCEEGLIQRSDIFGKRPCLLLEHKSDRVWYPISTVPCGCNTVFSLLWSDSPILLYLFFIWMQWGNIYLFFYSFSVIFLFGEYILNFCTICFFSALLLIHILYI